MGRFRDSLVSDAFQLFEHQADIEDSRWERQRGDGLIRLVGDDGLVGLSVRIALDDDSPTPDVDNPVIRDACLRVDLGLPSQIVCSSRIGRLDDEESLVMVSRRAIVDFLVQPRDVGNRHRLNARQR